jgi:hypothetical protein
MHRVALAILVIGMASACSKKEEVSPTSGAMPRTCDRPRIQAAVDEFDRLGARRDEALKQIEAVPVAEPAHYLEKLKDTQGQVRDLAAKAEKVEIPRCLQHAKDLFVRFLNQSGTTLDLRTPEADFANYRFALETTERIRTQYMAEIELQKKNEN